MNIFPLNCWKEENKEKEAENGPFLDSSVPSNLPPQGSSPKHTIYAFLDLYLNCVMWKRQIV